MRRTHGCLWVNTLLTSCAPLLREQASYGVESAGFAVAQLAQTTMRSEIGKMMLDQTFKERDKLNQV